MTTTYLLSQIKNFCECRVAYPHRLEVEAVVDAVCAEFPDADSYRGIAECGVSYDDEQAILACIAEHNLHCTLEECAIALERHCEQVAGEMPRGEEADNDG